MKVENIHNIYTHITGRAEGMVMAGGEADFPVMFAEAILDYYKKPWVGITDEEIEEGHKDSWVTKQAFESVCWWAEEKLRKKNTS
jgi:hypothetical protein